MPTPDPTPNATFPLCATLIALMREPLNEARPQLEALMADVPDLGDRLAAMGKTPVPTRAFLALAVQQQQMQVFFRRFSVSHTQSQKARFWGQALPRQPMVVASVYDNVLPLEDRWPALFCVPDLELNAALASPNGPTWAAHWFVDAMVSVNWRESMAEGAWAVERLKRVAAIAVPEAVASVAVYRLQTLLDNDALVTVDGDLRRMSDLASTRAALVEPWQDRFPQWTALWSDFVVPALEAGPQPIANAGVGAGSLSQMDGDETVVSPRLARLREDLAALHRESPARRGSEPATYPAWLDTVQQPQARQRFMDLGAHGLLVAGCARTGKLEASSRSVSVIDGRAHAAWEAALAEAPSAEALNALVSETIRVCCDRQTNPGFEPGRQRHLPEGLERAAARAAQRVGYTPRDAVALMETVAPLFNGSEGLLVANTVLAMGTDAWTAPALDELAADKIGPIEMQALAILMQVRSPGVLEATAPATQQALFEFRGDLGHGRDRLFDLCPDWFSLMGRFAPALPLEEKADLFARSLGRESQQPQDRGEQAQRRTGWLCSIAPQDRDRFYRLTVQALGGGQDAQDRLASQTSRMVSAWGEHPQPDQALASLRRLGTFNVRVVAALLGYRASAPQGDQASRLAALSDEEKRHLLSQALTFLDMTSRDPQVAKVGLGGSIATLQHLTFDLVESLPPFPPVRPGLLSWAGFCSIVAPFLLRPRPAWEADPVEPVAREAPRSDTPLPPTVLGKQEMDQLLTLLASQGPYAFERPLRAPPRPGRPQGDGRSLLAQSWLAAFEHGRLFALPKAVSTLTDEVGDPPRAKRGCKP